MLAMATMISFHQSLLQLLFKFTCLVTLHAYFGSKTVLKGTCCIISRLSVFCVRHFMTYYIHVGLTYQHFMFYYIMYRVRTLCSVAMLALYIKVKSLFFLF